jgi:hypothetical protein
MRQLAPFRAPAARAVAAVAIIGAACAYPVTTTAVRVSPTKSDSGAAAPIIQVRTYNISPTLSVIAWMDDSESYGLRATLSRSGDSLPSSSRLTDHRLYIGTSAIVEGGFRRATLDSRELVVAGTRRDSRPCEGGYCLPATTFGVLIPDAVLRGYQDTAVVQLITISNSQLDVVLPRELIAGYLRAVDSVSASLKVRAAAPR